MKQLLIILVGLAFAEAGSSADCGAAAATTPATAERHWAFTAPRKPELPAVRKADWARNPIDRFILARLEKEGVNPAAEAGTETLIRRVTLDLTGLPPTPAEVAAFVADTSPGAYEAVVDRLMATRAYAERRAQDWLDLARYADTRGFADDQTRDVWPYRDWVIEAINRNQRFDEFTVEQLAGDLLPDATLPQRIASAFNRNAPQAKGKTYPTEEYRLKGVVDRVNTTGTVWLGMTLSCAECHDHKFDPVTQAEYYKLFAIFNNIEHGGEGFEQGGPHLALPTVADAARLAELKPMIEAIKVDLAAIEKMLGAEAAKKEADAVRLKAAITKLTKEQNQINGRTTSLPVMVERSQRRETFVHLRGNFMTRGQKVEPGVPAMFGVGQEDQPRNRLELARWLVSGRSPLTARVVVNRFWQGYFGHGLVRTPMDFGVQGEMPTHPELLDWLAEEFVARGWDMKAMHRLIVTSATYRQSARIDPPLALRDPENRWLSHMPRVRLPAEQIRDQALAVSGLLQTYAGGRSVFPPQTEGYWEERALPGKWSASKGDDLHRRSMYTYWRRMALHPTLELLDAPSRAVCTAKRNIANLPTQALVTLNDPIFVEAAAALGRRILNEGRGDDATRVEFAFQLCLSRAPENEERSTFRAFLEQQTKRYPGDPAAAWSSVARILLNLDETLTRP